jgi:hypothetical protein
VFLLPARRTFILDSKQLSTDFIPKAEWPLSLPDLNSLDFSIEGLYSGTTKELKIPNFARFQKNYPKDLNSYS